MGQNSSTAIPRAKIDSLTACTYENTPVLSLEGQETLAKCVRVYDGDTVHLAIAVADNAGMPMYRRVKCRLAHINTAEMRSHDIAEANKARVAKQALSDMIDEKIVHVKFGRDDMYGRPLVTIYQYDAIAGNAGKIGECVNTRMITAGFAQPYEGEGTKAY